MFGSPTLESEIRNLLNGRLSKRQAEDLRTHIHEDEKARQLYDRLADAEAALEGFDDRPGLGSAGILRVQERLFNNLESPRSNPTVRSWATILGWAGLGATALAVTLIVGVPTPGDPEGGYQTRSGAVTKLDADHVLQVLRISFDAQGTASVVPATRLESGDHVRFAVFTRHRPGRLSVLAVHPGGTRQVLLDRASIKPSKRVERLDLPFEVPPAWSGAVRFVAVFDHGGTADPTTLALDPRDEPELSVRSVSTVIEESK